MGAGGGTNIQSIIISFRAPGTVLEASRRSGSINPGLQGAWILGMTGFFLPSHHCRIRGSRDKAVQSLKTRNPAKEPYPCHKGRGVSVSCGTFIASRTINTGTGARGICHMETEVSSPHKQDEKNTKNGFRRISSGILPHTCPNCS